MLDSDPQDSSTGAVLVSAPPTARHVALALRQFWWAQGVLGVMAVVSFVLVFARLLERWRVRPHTVSHHIAIFGQALSYPLANFAAIVILGLALLGVLVAAITITSSARELRATRRVARRLAAVHQGTVHNAFVIDDARPHAFCIGLFKPRVYVTTGALAILDQEALAAVLMHERHHACRRDPLRLAASRVLARALFFLPGLAELGRRRAMLAEISADESAISGAPGNRSALARAMLSFTASSAAPESVGIDSARVDHLLGEPTNWAFPALMFLLAVLLLSLVALAAVLVGQEATGSASLAPPFLSAQPCVVVFALIPAGVAVFILAVARLIRGGVAPLTSSG